mmetsp:Transcript_9891/g.29735  ORF Transcript_9891/g.29735 Transcript_9891/m.29735 type:complete len:90 (+) Transcript_9891:305-574(+)
MDDLIDLSLLGPNSVVILTSPSEQALREASTSDVKIYGTACLSESDAKQLLQASIAVSEPVFPWLKEVSLYRQRIFATACHLVSRWWVK